MVARFTENTVQANPLPRERLQAADFGGGRAVAGGIEKIGDQMATTAEVEQHIQIEHARTVAHDADNLATAQRQAILHQGPDAFYNKTGREAIDAAPDVQRQLQEVDRTVASTKLGKDPIAQAMYARIAEKRNTAEMVRFQGHLETQRGAYADAVDEGQVSTAVNSAALNYTDPAEIRRNIDTVKSVSTRFTARKFGVTLGPDGQPLSAEGRQIVDGAVRKQVSRVVTSVANEMNLKSPSLAQAFVAAHAGEMDQGDAAHLLKSLETDAAAEHAHAGVQPYLVTVETQDQATPGKPAPPGNTKPTSVPRGPAIYAAIGAQESKGHERNPDGSVVTSRAGARGSMQVMPATQGDPGYGVPALPENATDAQRAEQGRRYYDAMLKHYKGNVTLALTAYNWGPGNVDAHLKRAGDPRTGAISDAAWVQSIPVKEAREYAPGVLSKLGIHPSTSGNSPSSQAPDVGPTYKPPQLNLEATITKIEADPELSFAQKQAYKAEAIRLHGAGKQEEAETEHRVNDLALGEVNKLGDKYTKFEQIPVAIRAQMSPTQEHNFRGIAEAQAAEAERKRLAAQTPTSGSPQYFDLLQLATGDEAARRQFATLDLMDPKYHITGGERAQLIGTRGHMIKDEEARDRKAAVINIDRTRSYINRVAGTQPGQAGFISGKKATAEDNRRRMVLTDRVIARERAAQAVKGSPLTEEELTQIIASEIQPVTVSTPGRIWGVNHTAKPAYQVVSDPTHNPNFEMADPAGVPHADAQAIVRAFRLHNNGGIPTPDQVVEIYHRAQGR